MNIELSRFRVKEGKTKIVDEWMQFLNDNMEEVLLGKLFGPNPGSPTGHTHYGWWMLLDYCHPFPR